MSYAHTVSCMVQYTVHVHQYRHIHNYYHTQLYFAIESDRRTMILILVQYTVCMYLSIYLSIDSEY